MATDTADYSTIQTAPDDGADEPAETVVIDDAASNPPAVIEVGAQDVSAHAALALVHGVNPASSPAASAPSVASAPGPAQPPTAADLNNPANPASPLSLNALLHPGSVPASVSSGLPSEPREAHINVKLLDVELKDTLMRGAEFVGVGMVLVLLLVFGLRAMLRKGR